MGERFKYIVTNYWEPLETPYKEPEEPMTRQYFDTIEQAVSYFVDECKKLDTGCLQIWQGDDEQGRLYL